MTNGKPDKNPGSGWPFFGIWLAFEAASWILIGMLGFHGSVWALVSTLVIGVVFFMIFGVLRVLRGHDL